MKGSKEAGRLHVLPLEIVLRSVKTDEQPPVGAGRNLPSGSFRREDPIFRSQANIVRQQAAAMGIEPPAVRAGLRSAPAAH